MNISFIPLPKLISTSVTSYSAASDDLMIWPDVEGAFGDVQQMFSVWKSVYHQMKHS